MRQADLCVVTLRGLYDVLRDKNQSYETRGRRSISRLFTKPEWATVLRLLHPELPKVIRVNAKLNAVL